MRLTYNDFHEPRHEVEWPYVIIDHDHDMANEHDVVVVAHADHASLTLVVKPDQRVWLVDGGIEHEPPKIIGKNARLV